MARRVGANSAPRSQPARAQGGVAHLRPLAKGSAWRPRCVVARVRPLAKGSAWRPAPPLRGGPKKLAQWRGRAPPPLRQLFWPWARAGPGGPGPARRRRCPQQVGSSPPSPRPSQCCSDGAEEGRRKAKTRRPPRPRLRFARRKKGCAKRDGAEGGAAKKLTKDDAVLSRANEVNKAIYLQMKARKTIKRR